MKVMVWPFCDRIIVLMYSVQLPGLVLQKPQGSSVV